MTQHHKKERIKKIQGFISDLLLAAGCGAVVLGSNAVKLIPKKLKPP